MYLAAKIKSMALTNNDIIKKLRVALQLKDTDIINILKLVDFKISKTELSAFFRSEDHPNYKQLEDQILRNFLNGLVIYKRGPMQKKEEPSEETSKPADTNLKPRPRPRPKITKRRE
ncbi:MAG: DUF1456 family protein [Salinivirgaceae bacterium]|nr:DUF1456 family protein [Salinivirgaceae bacterium]